MIRNRFDSIVSLFWNRLSKILSKSGLVLEIKNRWMEVLYILGVVVMTAGLVNAAIQPVNIGYIIYPSTANQSATETFVDALALLIGAVGVYLSYLSGRQTTKSRMVNFLLTIGLLLIAVAVYIGIYVLGSK